MKRIGLFAVTLAFCAASFAQDEVVVSADRVIVNNGYDERYNPGKVFIISKRYRQVELVPEHFVCGFAVDRIFNSSDYGFFLVKERNRYRLVLNWKKPIPIQSIQTAGESAENLLPDWRNPVWTLYKCLC